MNIAREVPCATPGPGSSCEPLRRNVMDSMASGELAGAFEALQALGGESVVFWRGMGT